MSDVQELEHTLTNTIDSFFLRSGLGSQDQADCYTLLANLFPGIPISPATCQGYCSMTVFIGDEMVVQFRPRQYQLDLQVSDAACRVYGMYAPKTKSRAAIPLSGLLVYTMERIKGISYKDAWNITSEADLFTYRATLCRDLAAFMALSWNNKDSVADLPFSRVGNSLLARLTSLCTQLPIRFQPKANQILDRIQDVQTLPWVLTHGDLIAANIVVDSESGKLRGLVDWAEAERLPFGISFYGVEEILGELSVNGFHYHKHANKLRGIFWAELLKLIPDLKNNATFEAVQLARDFGVLLWYGIAFDNGSIDRVVQEGRDVEEITKLDAFLDLSVRKVPDLHAKI